MEGMPRSVADLHSKNFLRVPRSNFLHSLSVVGKKFGQIIRWRSWEISDPPLVFYQIEQVY